MTINSTVETAISRYLSKVNKLYQSGIAREHAYRADLQNLIQELVPDVNITNEPANVADCGNPDYVITRGKIPISYIEAKDVGLDLTSKQYKEQFERYRKALDSIVFTDYLTFRFYENNSFVDEVRIADSSDGKITPLAENFGPFNNRIQNLCTFVGQTIKSPQKLAELMAAKARLLQDTLEKAVTSDEDIEGDSSLRSQLETFRRMLIHDISPKEFADMYAQTLAYGMFAARLYDPTLDNFSRQEAAELIPKSNPFLRNLFQYIAGYNIDPRIRPTVDNLAEVFRATDVHALLTNFGEATQQHDPIIHFYETFLAEYDPKLRKSRGVWYTPEPVVNFIVRAVDDILKDEFGLEQGLADNSKTTIKVESQTTDKRYKSGIRTYDAEVHRVQILDPATGTGTFLAEVVKHIYQTRFKAMQGAWSGYVENHLIPRLNGFELLIASYAMAHLKLDLLFKETGYKPEKSQRFNIYLTNALEEHHPDTGTLFASWLSDEASAANRIKRDTPVMVVLGNPPYSGESANKGQWIMDLMEDYKREPGGKEKLKERNPKWINDDYVKFLRYGQSMIEKNGEGVLAFINPHGFLDNPTFRGMRWHLLKTYDKIYTIDLHGNSRKKEVSPDGSPDVNVFDIEQGVSINIFVKTGKKKPQDLAQVFHYDLYGKREEKYNFLWGNRLETVDFSLLPNSAPMYFMVQKNFELLKNYEIGFSVSTLFPINSVGIVTARDDLTVQHTQNKIIEVVNDFAVLDVEQARVKYQLGEDVRDWKVHLAQKDLLDTSLSLDKICKISYRPFDTRYTYFTGKSKGFHCMPRGQVMQHFISGKNIALMTCRQTVIDRWEHIGITKLIADDSRVSNRSKERGYIFPLYLYETSPDLFTSTPRKPNLNPDIITTIADGIGLPFVPDHELPEASNDNTFTPLDILDYIYAVLHSPTYRDTYKEFLKIDFPRVPYPKIDTFWQLVGLGGQLRQIHLLESPTVTEFITGYPMDGDNQVTRKMTKRSIGYEPTGDDVGKVWINDQQYFEGVPLVAWNFYIGGYQPAQKWLKDRVGRVLDFDDILHYQKIIVALSETDRIMQEIDQIDVL